MEILLIIHAYLTFITHVSLQHYNAWKMHDSKTHFEEYKETCLSILETNLKKSPPMKQEETDNAIKCVQTCSKMPMCRAVNVIQKQHSLFICQYLSTTVGQYKSWKNSTLFVFGEAQCIGYCEELSYLNVCDKCKCKSLCSRYLPHYCDCTHVQQMPLENCEKPYRVLDAYPLAGLYYVNLNDEIAIPAFCQSHQGDPKGELWITILRRLQIDDRVNPFDVFKRQGTEGYIAGFGSPYHVNYFMGYKNISLFTANRQNVRLSVIVSTTSKYFVYIEYTGFKMTPLGNGKYETSYKRLRRYNYKRDFLAMPNSNLDCAQAEIFGNCAKRKIQLRDNIRGVAVTYLMRSIESDASSTDDPTYSGRIISKVRVVKDSLCVTFEFNAESDHHGDNFIIYLGNDEYSYVWIDFYATHISVYLKNGRHLGDVDYSLGTFNRLKLDTFQKDSNSWQADVYLNGVRHINFVENGLALMPKGSKCRVYATRPSNKVLIRKLYVNGQRLID